MPRSYSQDFRKKVIEHVNKGKSCNAASIKFDIAANTVRNWYKRYKKEGHYQEKSRPGKQVRINKKEYIASNPSITLGQIGKQYGISIRTASYYMKKFGSSYKKTFTYVEADVEISQSYELTIKSIAKENLVYIDESGIETAICKDKDGAREVLL